MIYRPRQLSGNVRVKPYAVLVYSWESAVSISVKIALSEAVVSAFATGSSFPLRGPHPVVMIARTANTMIKRISLSLLAAIILFKNSPSYL
jgi:hypothetical protein